MYQQHAVACHPHCNHSPFSSCHSSLETGTFFGSLLTIPVICLGLANAMNLATAFVIDTFYGHQFMKKLLAWDSVVVGEF